MNAYKRPWELKGDIFYRSGKVELTPQVELLGQRAISTLIRQGFTNQDATERVTTHMHAAASFLAEGFSSQEEAELAIEPYRRPRGVDFIEPREAMTLTPFLAAQADFDFSPAHWMKTSLQVDQGSATRYMFRWLDLWQDDVSQEDTQNLLHAKSAEAWHETEMQIAHYAGMIVRRQNTAALTRAVNGITSNEYALPLLSQLGRASKVAQPLLDRAFGEDILPANGRARAVQHVDELTGACEDLETYHLASLFGSTRQVFIQSQGTMLGSLKLSGDKSLISMVTLEDDGRFPLVRGGVYAVNQAVVQKALSAANQEGSGAMIEVDSLNVRPLRFIHGYVGDESITWDVDETLDFLPQLEAIRAEQQAKLDKKSAPKSKAKTT